MKEKAESVSEIVVPALRFGVTEAARMLRMSRAQLYNRISDGALKPQKDGFPDLLHARRARAVRVGVRLTGAFRSSVLGCRSRR